MTGRSTVGEFCSPEQSGGIIADNGRSNSAIAASIVHQIGHNLGLTEDMLVCTYKLNHHDLFTALSMRVTERMFGDR